MICSALISSIRVLVDEVFIAYFVRNSKFTTIHYG